MRAHGNGELIGASAAIVELSNSLVVFRPRVEIAAEPPTVNSVSSAAVSTRLFEAASATHRSGNSCQIANPTTTEYSTSHPTGTGPFQFDSWERGNRVTLTRFEDYWGEKAKVDTVVADMFLGNYMDVGVGSEVMRSNYRIELALVALETRLPDDCLVLRHQLGGSGVADDRVRNAQRRESTCVDRL